MNKERAREILKKEREGVTNYFDMLGRYVYEKNQNGQLVEEIECALDLAIESLQEDKVTILYCANGKVYVVDSKKSLDELSSESCDKCKRNEELNEKILDVEPYFEIKPYKREE